MNHICLNTIIQCPKLQQQNGNISPWNFQWNMKQHVRKWSMRLRILKEPLSIIPNKWGIIFLTMKSKKKWVWKKCSKTQGPKEILREMDEGRLRSLENCFFFFFGIWLSQLSLTELTQLLAKFKCKGQNFGPPLLSFSLFFSFCFIFINFSFSINTIHLLLPLDFSSSSHHLFSQKTLF